MFLPFLYKDGEVGEAMIEIRQIEIPKEYVQCDSCGTHDGLKSVLVYQTACIRGQERRVSGSVPELRLCRECRLEMSRRLRL